MADTAFAASLAARLTLLFGRTAHGIKLGLDTERSLLAHLGNPQDAIPCVHVAGTNGKGSVCALIAAALRAAGYRTGLYTSPHLVRFNERIAVNGACITDEQLAALFEIVDAADRRIAAAPGGRPATFFEFTTALALEHFRRERVAVAVLETGLGGRLDATNVVTPRVTVITRLGIEHTAYLGGTLAEIAAEKAGIIKPGAPVIYAGAPEGEAFTVIAQTARERGARLVAAAEEVSVRRISQTLKGQKLKIETLGLALRPVVVPLLGRHQVENVAAAVAALEALNEESPFACDEKAMARGLAAVRWPARFQILSTEPPRVLDVAHNPGAAAALADCWRDVFGRRRMALVAGLLADKDAAGFFQALAPLVGASWLVPLPSERNMPPARLRAAARAAGLTPAHAAIPDALAAAERWAAANDGAVCICGSLFLAGEVFKLLAAGGEGLCGESNEAGDH